MDAVAWMIDASNLLPRCDRAWVRGPVEHHRLNVKSWRGGKAGFRPWRPEIDTYGPEGGLHRLTADGEIGWHTDEGFPPYSSLLILRHGGRSVTGTEVRRHMDRQPNGTLIMLRTHVLHSLCPRDVDWDEWCAVDEVHFHRPEPRVWVSACINWEREPSMEEVLAAYDRELPDLAKAA